MQVQSSFWSGRRVLVTGHTGFKGSWLALWLAEMGAEVHGIALDPETTPNHFELAGISTLMASDARIDIRDADATSIAVKAANPEIVFHLAAQALVRRAHSEPARTFGTNVMGTVHLLDSLRQVPGMLACVSITTDKVYRNVEWVWPYREEDALGGHEAYGASKAAAEMAIEAWRESWFAPNGVGLVAVRAGNVVGGGDWSKDRLVPDFIRAALQRKSLGMRNPDAVRPWQHVLEPLKGYLIAAEKLAADPHCLPAALNFGPDAVDFRTVRDVVNQAIDVWGEGATWHHESDERIPESNILTLDNALAKRALGWRPTWSFEECLARTVSWYKAAAETNADVAALTRADIADFLRGNV